MEASPVFYWGNLPMPQTPLDAHFYKQIKRTNPRTSHFYLFIKIELCFFTAQLSEKK